MRVQFFQSRREKIQLRLKQHPIQRVKARNEISPPTLVEIAEDVFSIVGFSKIVFAIERTTKTFNWVKTSVASRCNTTRPLIDRAHTKLTIIFSLPFRPAYWPPPSSSNERKRERETDPRVRHENDIYVRLYQSR